LNKQLLGLLAALVALAAVVAGCGSSSDTTESTEASESTASISKPDFVKQANSICATTEEKSNEEVNEFFEEEGLSKGEKPSQELEEQAVEEIVLPTISSQLEEIRALGFPDEKAESILTSAEEDLEQAEEEPSAIFSGNLFAQTNKEARAYGLTVCGSEGGEEEG
jgi:hypothetical protein